MNVVNSGLAHLSDTAFTTAIAIYTLALISYCGEYAFGRSGRIARTSVEQAPVAELVGAGATAAAGSTTAAAAGGGTTTTAGAATGTAVLTGDGGSPPERGGVSTVRAGSRDKAAAEERSARLAGRFGVAAVILTGLGWLLHLSSVAIRGIAVDRVPWGNMYEFSSAVGVVAVAAFLVVVVRVSRLRYLGMFVMLPVILLMFLAGTVLYAKAAPLVPALRSYWLAIHVTAAILATGIFMVSFVLTVLYLIRQRHDSLVAAGITPTRFPVTLGWRLPEAGVLDRIAYRTVAFGFPVWTFGIAAGAMWAEAAWGRYWGWDPKETWSFISWVVYAAYLHARATAGWKGVVAARINLLGFSTMIFNFFVVNMVISGLHSYAGLS